MPGRPGQPGRTRPPRRRLLHPLAWWGWALALAATAMRTTNPLLLLLLGAVVAFVVASRRTTAPWARSFTVALKLGAFLIVFRVVLAALFGMRLPGTTLFTLPSLSLPDAAAGVSIGGPVTLELLVQATVEGLRLAVIIACFGAANALASPHRLLRSMPAALYEAGVAVTVALSFVPHTVVALARVREARRLRGRAVRGVRALRHLVLPVLEGALDRSVELAASMDARGYGRRRAGVPATRRVATALTLGGFVGMGVGVYNLLDAGASRTMGLPVLAVSSLLLAAGMVAAGRRVPRTRYRPDPWGAPEWLACAAAAVAFAGLLLVGRIDHGTALSQSFHPLTAPAVPPVAVGAILVALVPAWTTPRPPVEVDPCPPPATVDAPGPVVAPAEVSR